MDVIYSPPGQDDRECAMLRRNMLTCLKQKLVKDEVPKMTCKPEWLLWFNLECPDESRKFRDPQYLRQTFVKQKQIDNSEKTPLFVKLGWE